MSSYDSGKKMKNPKGNRKGMTKKQESQEKGVRLEAKGSRCFNEEKRDKGVRGNRAAPRKMYMRIISWAKFLFLSIIHIWHSSFLKKLSLSILKLLC